MRVMPGLSASRPIRKPGWQFLCQVTLRVRAVPGATSSGSAPRRAQGSPSLPGDSSGAGSHEAAAVPHPAPSASRQVVTQGRSPPTRPGCPRSPRGLQRLWLQRMHIPFTCLCCNLRCSPAPAGVRKCPRAAWLMPGATVTPKARLSHLSPLPPTSKVSVPPCFCKEGK